MLIPVFFCATARGAFVNPSFESGSATGWSISTSASYSQIESSGAMDGTYCYKLWKSTPFTATFSQAATGLTPGKYKLSCWVQGVDKIEGLNAVDALPGTVTLTAYNGTTTYSKSWTTEGYGYKRFSLNTEVLGGGTLTITLQLASAEGGCDTIVDYFQLLADAGGLMNAGYENGGEGWTIQSSRAGGGVLNAPEFGTPAHGGSKAAKFWRYSDSYRFSLAQSVRDIPHYEGEYWLWVWVNGACGGNAWNKYASLALWAGNDAGWSRSAFFGKTAYGQRRYGMPVIPGSSGALDLLLQVQCNETSGSLGASGMNTEVDDWELMPPRHWIGGAGGATTNWNTAANWEPAGSAPGEYDDTYVSTRNTDPVLTNGQTALCRNLHVGSWDYDGRLTMTGGTLALTDFGTSVGQPNQYLVIGEGEHDGRLDMSTNSPVITMGHVTSMLVGYTGGYGVVNMLDGAISCTNLRVGLGSDFGDGPARGLFILTEGPGTTGTFVECTGNAEIGTKSTPGDTEESTGTLVIANGAYLSAANLIVGRDAGCTGTLVSNGWSWTEIASRIVVGTDDGRGTIQLNYGTLRGDSLEIGAGGEIAISNGMLILQGDRRSQISAYIANGRITHSGSPLNVRHDNTGRTMAGPQDHWMYKKAWNPAPDSASAWNSAESLVLGWEAGYGSSPAYDVYWGTSNPPTTKVSSAQSGRTYTPSGQSPGTTYYWRIDQIVGGVTTTGDVWSYTYAPSFGTLAFSIWDVKRIYDGFGAYVWPGDTASEAVFQELGLKYVQTQVTGISAMSAAYTGISNPDPEDFDAFWSSGASSMDSIKTLWKWAHENGCEMVLQAFQAPLDWCENYEYPVGVFGHVFREANKNKYVAMWTSLVDVYSNTEFDPVNHPGRKMRPPYILLFGELDGPWGTRCAPKIYADIVAGLRTSLDNAGYSDVKILGPGLAQMEDEVSQSGDDSTFVGDYITTMTTLPDIIATATNEFTTAEVNAEGGQSYIRDHWHNLQDAVDARDPDGLVKIFNSSFETFASTFHGYAFSPYYVPSEEGATDQVMFGSRLFENCASLLNLGANGGFIWESMDPVWDFERSAMVRKATQGSARRAGYWAMRTWLPRTPIGGSVLTPPSQSEPDMYVAATDKDGTVVFACCNNTTQTRTKRLRLNNIYGLGTPYVEQAWAYEKSFSTAQDPDYSEADFGTFTRRNLVSRSLGGGSYAIDASLPADSVLSVVFKYPILNLYGLWSMDDTGSTSTVVCADTVDGFLNSGRHGTFHDSGGSDAVIDHHVRGRRGGALRFDGTDDYVEIPSFSDSWTTGTFAAWIYPDGSQDSGDGILYTEADSGIGLKIGSGNRVVLRWRGTDYAADTGLTTGKWHFIAATVTPSTVKLYQEDDSTKGSQTVTTHSSLSLSSAGFSSVLRFGRAGSGYFKGDLDDLRIYKNRAMTPSEIQDLHDRGR